MADGWRSMPDDDVEKIAELYRQQVKEQLAKEAEAAKEAERKANQGQ